MGAIDWVCMVLGINKGAMISGLLGGLFSLKWYVESSMLGRVTAVAFGGLIANWWTEPVYAWFAIKGLHQSAIGFMIGLLAMTTAATVFKGIKEAKLGDAIAERFRQVIGAKPQPPGGGAA